jgi:hypothetical protein
MIYIITSMPDITEDITMLEPLFESTEIGHEKKIIMSTYSLCKEERNKDKKVLEKLRMEYLDPEEKEHFWKVCFNYQNVFYLPGDKLSCTNAVWQLI